MAHSVRIVSLAAALLVAVGAPCAFAEDDPKAELHRLYEEGANAFADGRYAVAASAFERAYRLKPAAATLYNIARAYDRQFIVDNDDQALKRAIETYREYLGDEKPTRRQEAVERLEALTYIQARHMPQPQPQRPSYTTPGAYQPPSYSPPIYSQPGRTDAHGLIEPWPQSGRALPPPVIVQPPGSAKPVAPAPASASKPAASSPAANRAPSARDESPTLLPAEDDEVPDPDRKAKVKASVTRTATGQPAKVVVNPHATWLKWVPAKAFLEGKK
jgi:hypothetical protein